MKVFKTYSLFLFVLSMVACKSSIKQQEDSVYSRHLQRHIPLTIITTAIPSKKEEMNLLLLNDVALLQEINAKKIIDSLYKKKLIQPILLVAFDGKEEDFGLEEGKPSNEKQIKKYNKFLSNELLTFIKKKALVTKFNTTAIAAVGIASINAFEVANNDDVQFQMVGMFSPIFSNNNLQTIGTFQSKSAIKIYMEDSGLDSSAIQFKKIMNAKQGIKECKLVSFENGNMSNKKPTIRNFAAFLLWAFPK